MWARLVILLIISLIIQVELSKDVIHQLAVKFGKPLNVCKEEMGLEDAVIQDFYNFWKEGHELTNRQTGCALLCITSKLDLLTPDLNLHHTNALEFAKNHGADESLAQQLVDMIHNCVKTSPWSAEDPCQNTLNVAICFKAEIHKLNWAPNVELLMAEFMTETKA